MRANFSVFETFFWSSEPKLFSCKFKLLVQKRWGNKFKLTFLINLVTLDATNTKTDHKQDHPWIVALLCGMWHYHVLEMLLVVTNDLRYSRIEMQITTVCLHFRYSCKRMDCSISGHIHHANIGGKSSQQPRSHWFLWLLYSSSCQSWWVRYVNIFKLDTYDFNFKCFKCSKVGITWMEFAYEIPSTCFYRETFPWFENFKNK